MDVTALPAGNENAGFAESHEMLGKVSLPPAKCCFKVANAGIAFTNGKKDLQPGGGADRLEEVGDRINGGYIHNPEYIIIPVFKSSVCYVMGSVKECHPGLAHKIYLPYTRGILFAEVRHDNEGICVLSGKTRADHCHTHKLGPN